MHYILLFKIYFEILCGIKLKFMALVLTMNIQTQNENISVVPITKQHILEPTNIKKSSWIYSYG